MRNTRVDDYEDVPRDVVAIGNDYPAQKEVPPHRHRRGQLIYAADGVITVITPESSWVVPPERAVWIPPGILHEVHMGTRTAMRSVYVRESAARTARLPGQCRVVAVSLLLRALLLEAVDLPLLYALEGREGRIMALLLDEIRALPALPLNTPLPHNRRLLRLCRQMLAAPTLALSTDEAAGTIDMSRRSFTRLFRGQTGMSFAAWRQQACLLAALQRLAEGEPVTRVAIELGYNSPSAFTAVFRRALGVPPSRYFATL